MPTSLSTEHQTALDEAVRWILSECAAVGIVVTGSIVRGNPGPSSDLDIVILHDLPGRRRAQRLFGRTPAEMFFNSEPWLRHCIASEASSGRPVMPHMLATGHIVLDTDGRMASLVDAAKETLLRGPGLKARTLCLDRYNAACLVEDVLDFEGRDCPDARRLLALAVDALLRHASLKHDQHLPRPKERMRLMRTADPQLSLLLDQAMLQPFKEGCLALRDASGLVLGGSGFFEWDSGYESAPAPEPTT